MPQFDQPFVEKMIELFGDNLADPKVFPKRSAFQVALTKFELSLEAERADDTTKQSDTSIEDQPNENQNGETENQQ